MIKRISCAVGGATIGFVIGDKIAWWYDLSNLSMKPYLWSEIAACAAGGALLGFLFGEPILQWLVEFWDDFP